MTEPGPDHRHQQPQPQARETSTNVELSACSRNNKAGWTSATTLLHNDVRDKIYASGGSCDPKKPGSVYVLQLRLAWPVLIQCGQAKTARVWN